MAEETIKEIDSWDVEKAIAMAKDITERYGARPYGFQFITRERKACDLDSKITKTSGMYYINGIVETLEEIKAKNDPSNRILISNMENNHWDRVVTTHTPWRWTMVFNENDHIVNI